MVSHHHKDTLENINCAVITVSDTRTKETDKSGRQIIELLDGANHTVRVYQIIADDGDMIQKTVKDVISHNEIEAVIINGGTGISYRDVTIESIEFLFDKQLPGFGELFRLLSYKHDIGTASMLSRAICGVANHRLVFSLPGSTSAVTLAMERLVLPEIGHMLREVKKECNRH